MTMAQNDVRFWLDYDGSVPCPAGLRVLGTERALLTHGREPGPFLVRGPILCQWARDIALARRWSHQPVEAPWRRVHKIAPGLAEQAAGRLVAGLDSEAGWKLAAEPITAVVVMATFEPANSLWRSTSAGAERALRLLAWWLDPARMRELEPVVRAAGAEWAAASHGGAADALAEVDSHEAARQLAFAWLIEGKTAAFGVPRPSDVPDRVHQTVVDAAELGLRSGAIAFDAVVRWVVWKPIASAVASAVAIVAIEQKAAITAPLLAWLQNNGLPESELASVRQLLTRADPGEPPPTLAAVAEWYVERYLPWRESKESKPGDDPDHHRWRELGGLFGRWYVEQYPRIRSNAADAEWLVWVKANHLESEADGITVLVILDGALKRDADRLLGKIRDAIGGSLTVTADEVAMAPLPTVTDFTKRTIIAGAQAVEATSGTQGDVAPNTDRVIAAMAAGGGQTIVWRHVQPDRAYHFSTSGQLAIDVDGELYKIAGYIREVVKAAPNHRGLRLIITSDHGRLLGESSRSLVPPRGTVGHGRAAWGAASRPLPPSQAYQVDDALGVAWLDPASYGLPAGNAYAVSLTDHAFRTADGKGGVEAYSHGGVFPEEVFVPWIVLERDVVVHPLRIAFSGDGVAGDRGGLRIRIDNDNRFNVTVVAMTLTAKGSGGPGPLRFEGRRPIAAGGALEETRDVLPWPDYGAMGAVRLEVEYLLPGGKAAMVMHVGTVETRAMYRTNDNLLDEFGDF
jgi:hypothetical protein